MKTSIHEQKILFLDSESSGFNPDDNAMLEVAYCITDMRGNNPVHETQAFLKPDEFTKWAWNEDTLEFHKNNGFYARWNAADKQSIHEAELQLLRVLKLSGNPGDIVLGGRSVHFDRAFIKKNMRLVDAYLGHRHIDTSVGYALFSTAGIEMQKPEAPHQALADMRLSIHDWKAQLELAERAKTSTNTTTTFIPEADMSTSGHFYVTEPNFKISNLSGNKMTNKMPDMHKVYGEVVKADNVMADSADKQTRDWVKEQASKA